MNPVCANCGAMMKVAKIGVTFVEMISKEDPAPYKLWKCDRFECPKCRNAVLSGFGRKPYAETLNRDFNEDVQEALGDTESVLERY